MELIGIFEEMQRKLMENYNIENGIVSVTVSKDLYDKIIYENVLDIKEEYQQIWISTMSGKIQIDVDKRAMIQEKRDEIRKLNKEITALGGRVS